MVSTFGYGNYNAASAKLEKRYSNGLQFVSAFTWSHTLANSSTPLGGSSNFAPKTQTDWSTGYADAAWDVPLNFTTGFNYDLPFGKGKHFGDNLNRFADLVIGGWTWNGLLTLRDGQPFTIAGTSCQGVWSRCEPDLVAGGNPNAAPANGRIPSEWFNTANFAVAAPLTGGDLGIQSNFGPPTRTLDTSLFKTFSLTERFKMQFRAEVFNMANTPQFGLPDASLSDSKQAGGNGKFGTITSTQAESERHYQFSLKLLF
jgi:hypothetical protein